VSDAKYYLGLDAGGTKTFCLVGDAQGNILGFGRGGRGNYETHGVEPAARENQKAVDEALADAGLTLADIRGIGMGIAGADLPEDYVMLEREMYTPMLGDIPRDFRNDSMGGLRGGLRHPFGVVIACGTGCVCAGRNRAGDDHRVGGLGDEFGDETSGSSIGAQGIRTVWQARDGIVAPTRMTDLFVQRAGCADREDLFLKLYRQEISYTDLEPMAKIVFDGASAGDEAACDILEQGGRYLGAMVNGAAKHLGMAQEAFDVVMTGSVFKGSSPVLADAMTTVIHRVCPQARMVRAAFEPVVGALLMGMELDLEISDEIYQNIGNKLDEAQTRYAVGFRAE
jgi:N-acetylglucosamine kinase-like BadF-type ATPase